MLTVRVSIDVIQDKHVKNPRLRANVIRHPRY